MEKRRAVKALYKLQQQRVANEKELEEASVETPKENEQANESRTNTPKKEPIDSEYLRNAIAFFYNDTSTTASTTTLDQGQRGLSVYASVLNRLGRGRGTANICQDGMSVGNAINEESVGNIPTVETKAAGRAERRFLLAVAPMP